MATYNGEQYIKEQIDSILYQLSENDEVIISDDSSTDTTVDIIKSYEDSRIVLYENQKFKSPIFNFENAIKQSTGDIIVLADQDDVWLSNKTEIINSYFTSKLSLLVMNAKLVDENLKVIDNSIFDKLKSKKGFLKNMYRNSYLGCSMAFSSDLKKYILPFPRKISMHDVWIGLISEIYGHVFFNDKITLLHRRHSRTSTKNSYSLMQKIIWRLYNFYYILISIVTKGIK